MGKSKVVMRVLADLRLQNQHRSKLTAVKVQMYNPMPKQKTDPQASGYDLLRGQTAAYQSKLLVTELRCK
jgi:hypothetical protein